MQSSRAVATLLIAALLSACAYHIATEQPPIMRRPAEPARVTVRVLVPDFESSEAREKLDNPTMRWLAQDLYLDFARALRNSGLFVSVEQVEATVEQFDQVPPHPQTLTALLHPDKTEIEGTWSKLLLDFVSGLTFFLLSPVLEAHESITISLRLELRGPPLTAPRRYAASGTATLISHEFSPRAEAVLETMRAAQRIAFANLLDQVSRDLDAYRVEAGKEHAEESVGSRTTPSDPGKIPITPSPSVVKPTPPSGSKSAPTSPACPWGMYWKTGSGCVKIGE